MSEELMQAHLSHARQHGQRVWPGLPGEECYAVDIRGTITFCRFTESIQIDYHDMFAYWAPNRKVTFCEGGLAELQKHLDLNNNPSLVATTYGA